MPHLLVFICAIVLALFTLAQLWTTAAKPSTRQQRRTGGYASVQPNPPEHDIRA